MFYIHYTAAFTAFSTEDLHHRLHYTSIISHRIRVPNIKYLERTRDYSGTVRPGTNAIMLRGNVWYNKDVDCETDSEKKNNK